MGRAEGGRRPPLAKRLGCPHPPLGREKKGGVQRGAAPRKEAIVKEKTFFQKLFQKLHVCVQLSPSSGVRVKGVVLNDKFRKTSGHHRPRRRGGHAGAGAAQQPEPPRGGYPERHLPARSSAARCRRQGAAPGGHRELSFRFG